MEIFRALALFAEPVRATHAHVAEALELGALPAESEYTETFIFQLYPYASVYLGGEGMMGGEARDAVAGFWRALNLTPPAEPDHLAVMLALYAELAGREGEASDERARAALHQARKAFLHEHLLSWLHVYLRKLQEVAAPFYQRWSETLKRALLEELEEVGQSQQLPLHLRDSLSLRDPREDEWEEFLQSLLAPARSGMILTRADLMRAAQSLGLALRMGERKFILRSLFHQNAKEVLRWLREEAARWQEIHRQEQEALGTIAAAWLEKSRASVKLLEELRRAAEEVG